MEVQNLEEIAHMEAERRKLRIAIEEKAMEELRSHMYAEDNEKERNKKWHVGKEIPLALILTLIAQTVGVVWWAATISTTQKADHDAFVVATAVQQTVDRKQDEESKRAEDRVVVQLDKLNTKVDKLIERIPTK